MYAHITIPRRASEVRPGDRIAHHPDPDVPTFTQDFEVDEIQLGRTGVSFAMRHVQADGTATTAGRRTVAQYDNDAIVDVLPTHDQLDAIARWLAHSLSPDDFTVSVRWWVLDSWDRYDLISPYTYSLPAAMSLDAHLELDGGKVTMVDNAAADRTKWREHSVLLNTLGWQLGLATDRWSNEATRGDIADQGDLVQWLEELIDQRDRAMAGSRDSAAFVNRLGEEHDAERAAWLAERDELMQTIGALSADVGDRDAELDRVVRRPTDPADVAVMPMPAGMTAAQVLAEVEADVSGDRPKATRFGALAHTFVPLMVKDPDSDASRPTRTCAECGNPSDHAIHQQYQRPAEFDPATQARPQIVDGVPNGEVRDAVLLDSNGCCPTTGMLPENCGVVHDHLEPNTDALDPDDELDAALASLDAGELVIEHDPSGSGRVEVVSRGDADL